MTACDGYTIQDLDVYWYIRDYIRAEKAGKRPIECIPVCPVLRDKLICEAAVSNIPGLAEDTRAVQNNEHEEFCRIFVTCCVIFLVFAYFTVLL